jgi:hypothetical protein
MNAPLDSVIAHELSHWMVTQELGLYPNGLDIKGIVHEATGTIAQFGSVPFQHALPRIRERAAIYAGGHVGERLFIERDLNPKSLYESFFGDPTCLHDLTRLRNSLAESYGSSEAIPRADIETALADALEVLLPRMEHLIRETGVLGAMIRFNQLTSFELEWSAEFTARLCGRTPDWYDV